MKQLKKFHQWSLKFCDKLQWLPGLLTRLAVGFVFLQAGWGKFHRLSQVAGFFSQLGIPFPHFQAPFVAGAEFICGGLLIVGYLTRYAAVPLMIIMAVALMTAERSEIHSVTDLFGIADFLYFLLLGWLAAKGAGKFSLDHHYTEKKK